MQVFLLFFPIAVDAFRLVRARVGHLERRRNDSDSRSHDHVGRGYVREIMIFRLLFFRDSYHFLLLSANRTNAANLI